MIADLPGTTTKDVSKYLVKLRNEVGAMTLGRVMTLIIVTDDRDADSALAAAINASREHPSRIIAIVRGDKRGTSRMDAQVRVGGDAGASEVVVLRLYGELADHGVSVVMPLLLTDSPIVAWWPMNATEDVGRSPIGKLAVRRITDASLSPNPRKEIDRRRRTYVDGDTDMAWARTTRWRGLLAAALDLAPYEAITQATVTGASDSASTDLLAGWLAIKLKVPVRRARGPRGLGIISVRLDRPTGPIDLVRDAAGRAVLTQPGQPPRHVALARPGTAQSLAEELRRLDQDVVYRDALVRGMPKVIDVQAAKAARAAAPAPTAQAVQDTADPETATPPAATKAAAKKAPAKKVAATKAAATKTATRAATSKRTTATKRTAAKKSSAPTRKA